MSYLQKTRAVGVLHLKQTSDVTANVTAVAKTPKHISEPRFFCQVLYDGIHRTPLVTVNVRLPGAGHDGACCSSRTFAAFIPHCGEWSASLSGRLLTFWTPRPGKSSVPMEKGIGGPEKRSGRLGEGKTFFAPTGNRSPNRQTQQSSFVHCCLIYLVMFTTVSLSNDTFSGSKRRTSNGGIKGFRPKR